MKMKKEKRGTDNGGATKIYINTEGTNLTYVVQASLIEQNLLQDECGNGFAQLGPRLHDPKAERNDLCREQEVDHLLLVRLFWQGKTGINFKSQDIRFKFSVTVFFEIVERKILHVMYEYFKNTTS